ncbi:hypothetical protein [Variovorax ginsengisoli]|uniref:DUF2867 domain-containing protein n=1 Tax=Variovorax ginsengisoli TaxID=363844 RepID=A0ABT8SB68_9BURK|nr:hypothetical protein [Variovorax ginsengisoli]MDN8616984.1 hypothetical protein [Variovorax ginsengisoli]MDO1536154.1 hypothetical protein [Variovorax ginsengisoli]
MPLIDDFLPAFQFRERHALITRATPKALLNAVLLPGVAEDPLARFFIRLREAPDQLLGARSGLAGRPAFGIEDFMILGRDADRELVFGLVGRFWQRDYGLVTLAHPRQQFAGFSEPGLAKLVLNFSTEALPGGRTRLMTETRVHCVDASARRRFTPYWWLIRPVSGLIRRRLLVRIDDAALRAHHR